MDNICAVISSCTGRKTRRSGETQSSRLHVGAHRGSFLCWKPLSPSRLQPHLWRWAAGRKWSQERLFLRSRCGNSDFLTLHMAGTKVFFPQMSLDGRNAHPAKPCLEVLMAGPLVRRISLQIWQSSQEKMLLVRPLDVLALFQHPEAFRAVSQMQR